LKGEGEGGRRIKYSKGGEEIGHGRGKAKASPLALADWHWRQALMPFEIDKRQCKIAILQNGFFFMPIAHSLLRPSMNDHLH
jgi:hypothetical protein